VDIAFHSARDNLDLTMVSSNVLQDRRDQQRHIHHFSKHFLVSWAI
jgi:hypothetical protein